MDVPVKLELGGLSELPAEEVCSSLHMPLSCLDLAEALIQDMESLGWSARFRDIWMI